MFDPEPDRAAEPAAEEAASYLTVLVRLAELEGIAAPEQAFIGRVAASLGIDPRTLREAGELPGGGALPTAELIARIGDPGLRVWLLRDAYRLAAADGGVSDAELRELSGIVDALGIAHGTAAAVRSVALQEARLERELARLVRAARG